jgi:hypothetical protein
VTDRFLDSNGETRLSGTLVAPGGLLPVGGTTGQVLTKASNADGDADWETGGGYTPPTERALYSGNGNSIADGIEGHLSWDSLDAGTALLDIVSDPESPTVVTEGIYSVAVVVRGSSLTVGGYYRATLVLDGNGFDGEIGADASATAALVSPRVGLAACLYLPAGAVVVVKVLNHDGVSARSFTPLQVVVQRIT